MRRSLMIVAQVGLLMLIGTSLYAQNAPSGAGPQMGMMGAMSMDDMMKMMGMMHPSIAVDDTSIYIVRGNELLKLDKTSLRVLSRTMLPMATMGGATGAGTGGGPGMAGGTMGSPSVPFDRSFLQNMIRHHAGAIVMSRILETKATHPELRLFARRVIQTQSAQDREMTVWLRDWFGAKPSTSPMPEDEQTTMQLRGLSGKNLEIAYMRAMIAHHERAIEMGRTAEQSATHAQAKTLAANIVRNQSKEVEQLRGWLSQWYGVSG